VVAMSDLTKKRVYFDTTLLARFIKFCRHRTASKEVGQRRNAARTLLSSQSNLRPTRKRNNSCSICYGTNGLENRLPTTNKHMKKILVVDDSPVILKTLSMKLTGAGYEALVAEDGGTAVSLVRNERPDLVILDISFPPDVGHGGGIPWDGFLILEWLRRLDEAKHIPFIIIT